MHFNQDQQRLTLQLDGNMIDKYALKVIISVQFVLTTWSALGEWGTSFTLMNTVLLLCGLWAIATPGNVDSLQMLIVFEAISILNDIIILAAGFSSRNALCVNLGSCGSFRFSAAMAIIHILIKPIIIFFLIREYRNRGGNYSMGFPGSTPGGGYENLDQSVPSNSGIEPSPYNPQPSPFVPQ